MSSNTQFYVTVPREIYRLQGDEVLRLDRILGAGGRDLLLKTLETLPELKKGLDADIARELNWERVSGTDRFETLVGKTQVSLRIGRHVAELSYTDEFGTSGSVYETAAQSVRKAVNKKVNQLLAVAVAQGMKQQVTQYRNTNNIQLTIQRTVANKINVRTLARFKA